MSRPSPGGTFTSCAAPGLALPDLLRLPVRACRKLVLPAQCFVGVVSNFEFIVFFCEGEVIGAAFVGPP